jgi:uncharacterized protein YndB with AHSA1/START domain
VTNVASDPIVKEIYIDASPSVVFQFLTDPKKMLRWMGIRAEIDPKAGGIYRVEPNGRDIIRGEYLEVVTDTRVVFTWGFEGGGYHVPAGSSRVEIDLTPEGRGTRLRLTHRGLPPEAREGHDAGWGHYLGRLKTVSEGGEVGVDPMSDPNVRHG